MVITYCFECFYISVFQHLASVYSFLSFFVTNNHFYIDYCATPCFCTVNQIDGLDFFKLCMLYTVGTQFF